MTPQSPRSSRFLTYVVLFALLTLLPTAGHAQSTTITTAQIDGTWVDIDRSGNPTCGDAIDFTVTIAAAPGADAQKTELVLPIDARTTLDPTSVVVSAPQGNPQVVRADSVLDVFFGTVCGPAPCTAATVKFRTYIAFFSIGPDIFEQGTVSASNAASVDTNAFFQPFVSCATRPPATDLALSKSDGGITADPGGTIPYTLTVRSQGSATAVASVLRETVPAATTFNAAASSPGWSCSGTAAGSTCSFSLGDLSPGAVIAKVFAVTADLPFPTGLTQVTNTATVSTTSQEANLANNSATISTPVRPGNPDLRLVKSLAGGAATPGSTLLYSLTLTNLGNATARAASLTETVPANTAFVAGSSTSGWTCSPDTNAGASCALAAGDLVPNQATTATFAVRLVNPLPAGVTAVANSACSTTTTTGDPTANNCSTVTTPAQGTPALSLKKTLTSGSGTPGATLVFTLTTTNNGNQGAAGVVLTETVPANTIFSAAASSPGWSCTAPSAGSTCTLSLGTLAGGGASMARTFAVVIDNPLPAGVASVQNTACAAAGSLQSCDTATVPTNGAPALTLKKTLSSGTGTPGSTLVYALTVTNSGNQAAANLRLTETVPANTTFAPASSATGWTCSPGTSAGSSCTFSLPTLAGGGASTTVLYAVTIVTPLPAGVTQITNTACLQGAPSANLCDQITTPTTGRPVLAVVKALTAGTPAPGNTLTYTLTITNSGDQNAAGVLLSDQLPPGTAFVPASSSPGWTCSPTDLSPSTCTLLVGAVAAQASASRTIALALANPWPAGNTTLTNTGCATDDSGKIACSTIDTPVDAAPELSLSKTYSGPSLQAGAHLLFDLALTNTGNQEASGVLVHETVPLNTSFDPAASAPGWTCNAPAAASPCTLTLATLNPGQTVHLAFAVVAANPLPPGVTQVTNSACASLPSPTVRQNRAAADTSCSQVTTPLSVFVKATLTADLAYDVNHDAYPETDDVLLYTLIVSNPSPGPANNVRVSVPALDPHLQLLPESIVTSAGTVAATQVPTDPIVTIPILAPGGSVIITFRAQVVGALPPSLRFLSTQGSVAGANISTLPTDDPGTPEANDPTRTPLRPQGPAVHDVPTLSGLGLVALSFALAGATLVFLRRRLPVKAAAAAR
jgi:uncharacterized repeat protein (TIGR01451 family)